MTKAERLRHPCPKCHQKAGAPCVDPLGDVMPRCHATRGPGQHEAHKAREAERINARAVASYGPLFADLAAQEVKPVTAAELIDRDRRAAALAFDAAGGPSGLALLRQCNRGLEWLWVHHVARALAQAAGPVGAELAAHAIRTFPTDYLRHTFQRYMTTTEAHNVGPYRVEEPGTRLGFRVAYRYTWEPAAPLMTPAEFDAAFPAPNHWTGTPDQEEPEAAGELFARTVAALARNQELPR